MDGVQWTFASKAAGFLQDGAYSLDVALQNKTVVTLARRERPHLLLDTTGNPSVLTNGVQSAGFSSTPGLDWTYTAAFLVGSSTSNDAIIGARMPIKSDEEGSARRVIPPRVASPCFGALPGTAWTLADKQRRLQSVALELYNRRAQQHYTENSTLRWRGVSEKMCPPEQLPVYSDCSSFVTYIYWTLFGDSHDFMNSENWLGGWTGSLAKHGALVKGPGGGNASVTPAELQVGDLIFYCK